MKSVRFLLFTTAASLVFASCSRHHSSTAATTELPVANVQAITVHTENQPVLTETTGTVRAVKRAAVAAKVMGVIESLPVTLGQSVRAGDVLLTISAGEISARVLQAQSQLNVVRRDLERERDLLTKGASTADLVKGLEDRLAMTEAMVREAEVMVSYTTLRAPFNGVIASKKVNAGDLAAPGQTLLEIENPDTYEIETPLPDSLVGGLQQGSKLNVNVPVARVTFEGSVTELSSTADASAHTVLAKISVPAGTAVRSGQFARVQVPGAAAPVLLVPATAISRFGQLERLWIVSAENRAVLRLVKSGAAHGDRIEILSGVDDGEKVIVTPPADLREGQPVETA